MHWFFHKSANISKVQLASPSLGLCNCLLTSWVRAGTFSNIARNIISLFPYYLFIILKFKYDVTFKMSFSCLEWNYSLLYHSDTVSLNTFSSAALALWNCFLHSAISLCFHTPSKLPQEPLLELLHSWLLPNARNLHKATLFLHLFS